MVNNINDMSEMGVLDTLIDLEYRLTRLRDEIESTYDSTDELIEARTILKGIELAKVLKVIL